MKVYSHEDKSFFENNVHTDNEIGDIGATSLSDALKSNTTLTQLSLRGKYKWHNTKQSQSINNPLLSILNKSTGNDIGEAGAASLSDALKSNTALAKLNLSCEYKRNNTQMTSTNNPIFHFIQ